MRSTGSHLKAAIEAAGLGRDELFDMNMVARVCNRNLISCYRDSRSGLLKTVRFGRTIRVRRAALEDYLAGGKQ
jgi:hypothetical protein